MTEKQALKMNLIPTSISDYFCDEKDYCKKSASELRKEFGGKAYVVTLNNGYKRVFIDDRNSTRMFAKECQQRLENGIPYEKQQLLENYKKALAEIERQESYCKRFIAECNEKYPKE